MNILILTHSYPNTNNPLKATFIRDQVNALSRFYSITVVFFRIDYSHFGLIPGYSFSKEVSGNITLYKVTVKKSLPGITQINSLVNIYRFIVKEILAKNPPDIIHGHFSYPGGFLGTIIQKRKRIPNVITEHTRIGAYSRSWYHKQCIKYSIRNTSSMISVSNFLKTEIEGVFQRPITIIPNFVDSDIFKIPLTKTTHRINIGFLGAVESKNKRMDVFLKSASLLDKTRFTLHIGGESSLIETFRKKAKEMDFEDNCNFYGEISRNKIADFYSRLDIFVLASDYETFGIVLIEAMSCGIPVIATKCGGPQEIITQETGLLVERNNPSELANAINKMSENLERYNNTSIRNYAESKFGKSVFLAKISDVYSATLNKYFKN
jgi:glycosyltransferase involved in cell wall biosynthesis